MSSSTDNTFVPINGFSEYSINPLGLVKNNKTNKVVKAFFSRGSVKVNLYDNAFKHHCRCLHTLVGNHFLPKQTGGEHIIIHIDGDVSNCKASNLQWVLPLNAFELNQPISDEDKKWIAGFCDGDGNLSLHFSETKQSIPRYVPGFVFSQSQNEGEPKVLTKIQSLYGGSIRSKKSQKNTLRTSHKLYIRRKENVQALLRLMIEHSVIKYYQARFLLDIYDHPPSTFKAAQKILTDFKKMHHSYADVVINSSRLTPPYIAGLFDAEGCVCLNKRHELHISVAQESSKNLLSEIANKYQGNDTKHEVVWHGVNSREILEMLSTRCVGKTPQILQALEFLKNPLKRAEPANIRKRKLEDRETIYQELKRMKKI